MFGFQLRSLRLPALPCFFCGDFSPVAGVVSSRALRAWLSSRISQARRRTAFPPRRTPGQARCVGRAAAVGGLYCSQWPDHRCDHRDVADLLGRRGEAGPVGQTVRKQILRYLARWASWCREDREIALRRSRSSHPWAAPRTSCKWAETGWTSTSSGSMRSKRSTKAFRVCLLDGMHRIAVPPAFSQLVKIGLPRRQSSQPAGDERPRWRLIVRLLGRA